MLHISPWWAKGLVERVGLSSPPPPPPTPPLSLYAMLEYRRFLLIARVAFACQGGRGGGYFLCTFLILELLQLLLTLIPSSFCPRNEVAHVKGLDRFLRVTVCRCVHAMSSNYFPCSSFFSFSFVSFRVFLLFF